jgi:hypothetical protein
MTDWLLREDGTLRNPLHDMGVGFLQVVKQCGELNMWVDLRGGGATGDLKT